MPWPSCSPDRSLKNANPALRGHRRCDLAGAEYRLAEPATGQK
jgi:hypothetical protein